MRLTVLGSGTAAPEADRVCSAYLVEAGATRLLLDCGPGAVHHAARFGAEWAAITHVALTHFHNDHVGDLPYLFFAWSWGRAEPRSAPLTVLGPTGTRALLAGMGRLFGSHVAKPPFRVEVLEVGHGDAVELGDTRVRVHRTPHTDQSVAYRVEADGAVGYTGDTEHDAALAAFFAGVDLLIAECSLPDDEAVAGHLTPSGLAELARRARPGRLVVTHVYPQLARLDVAGLLADAGWDGVAVRARDGLVLETEASVDDSGTFG